MKLDRIETIHFRRLFLKWNLVVLLPILFLLMGCSNSEGDPELIVDIPDESIDVPYNPKLPLTDQENLGGWNLVSELSHEFSDGLLNNPLWEKFYPGWSGRSPSWFTENNVQVVDTALIISMRKEQLPEMEAGYEYTTGILRSTNTITYGYFEIKAKPMHSAGSSSFFLNNNQADWWTEIDIYEIGGNAMGYEFLINTNVHEFYTPENVIEPYVINEETHYQNSLPVPVNWRPDADFHVYGLDWNEANIKWYVDGELIREIPNERWHQELYLNIDSEIIAEWFGVPEDQDLPAYYAIDYIRTWED